MPGWVQHHSLYLFNLLKCGSYSPRAGPITRVRHDPGCPECRLRRHRWARCRRPPEPPQPQAPRAGETIVCLPRSANRRAAQARPRRRVSTRLSSPRPGWPRTAAAQPRRERRRTAGMPDDECTHRGGSPPSGRAGVAPGCERDAQAHDPEGVAQDIRPVDQIHASAHPPCRHSAGIASAAETAGWTCAGASPAPARASGGRGAAIRPS